MKRLPGRKRLEFYVSDADLEAIKRAAAADHRPVSSWCRVRLLDAAYSLNRDSKQHPPLKAAAGRE